MKIPTSLIVFAAMALSLAPAATRAADLLIHDGFEVCWVTAKTKPQFLESIRTSIDGTSACIPSQSGSQSGVDYTICGNANGCGSGVQGCPVAIQAGTFSGDFVAGHFVGPGTASNIVVPITTSVLGACNVNLTAINLGYTLDYLMQTDGTDGVYTIGMLAPAVDIVSYSTSNNCNPVLAALISTYVPQAIGQAEAAAAVAIEPGLRSDTLDRAVCPLSAP